MSTRSTAFPESATVQRGDESGVRAVIDAIAAAVRARNVEGMLAQCAEDVVVYDLVPPLEHKGVASIRQVWTEALSAFEAPVEYDVQHLDVAVSGDVALARSLNRFGGARKDGTRVVNWMRSTLGLRRIDGRWKVVHEHVSVPFDMKTDKALLDLTP
jgi:uncharacterized protein (TIGR02246 family)